MTLIATPMPVDDESLISLLLRTTAANGLRSIDSLCRRIEHPSVPTTKELLHGPPAAWFNAAEALTGIHRDHLAAGTRTQSKFHSLRHWRPRREYRLFIYCPACLSEDGALRLEWQLPYVRACRIHEIPLVNHRRWCHDKPALITRLRYVSRIADVCAKERCGLPRGGWAQPLQPGELSSQGHLTHLDEQGLIRLVTADAPPPDDVHPDELLEGDGRCGMFDVPRYVRILDRPR